MLPNYKPKTSTMHRYSILDEKSQLFHLNVLWSFSTESCKVNSYQAFVLQVKPMKRFFRKFHFFIMQVTNPSCYSYKSFTKKLTCSFPVSKQTTWQLVCKMFCASYELIMGQLTTLVHFPKFVSTEL